MKNIMQTAERRQWMTQLLVFKEQIQKFYQKYALILNPLFRFIIGYITFYAANRVIGYNPLLNSFWTEVILGCISVVFPMPVLLFFACVFIVVQIAYVSNYLAFTMAIMLAVIYFLYVRFLPKHGFIILAMPILYSFNIPYALPILMGLIATPVSVVPLGFGVVVYYLILDTIYVISTSTEDTISLYKLVMQQLSSDTQMYVTIIIFAVVTVVVYFIRNRKVDYAFEIAIVTGAFLNIILFLTTNYLMDININIVNLLVGILVSGLLAWIIQFFRLSLNYAGVENLQFEDEEYYYYVRAVPKTNIAAARKRVKRFNAHHSEGNVIEEETAEEDFYDKESSGSNGALHNKDAKPEHDFEFTVSLDKEDFEELKRED